MVLSFTSMEKEMEFGFVLVVQEKTFDARGEILLRSFLNIALDVYRG